MIPNTAPRNPPFFFGGPPFFPPVLGHGGGQDKTGLARFPLPRAAGSVHIAEGNLSDSMPHCLPVAKFHAGSKQQRGGGGDEARGRVARRGRARQRRNIRAGRRGRSAHAARAPRSACRQPGPPPRATRRRQRGDRLTPAARRRQPRLLGATDTSSARATRTDPDGSDGSEQRRGARRPGPPRRRGAAARRDGPGRRGVTATGLDSDRRRARRSRVDLRQVRSAHALAAPQQCLR